MRRVGEHQDDEIIREQVELERAAKGDSDKGQKRHGGPDTGPRLSGAGFARSHRERKHQKDAEPTLGIERGVNQAGAGECSKREGSPRYGYAAKKSRE